MNYLDIIILVPLLYALIKGFSNGLIKEISGLLGLIIGVYVASNFSFYLYPKFIGFFPGHEDFVPIIAFTTLFVVSVLTIKVLGNVLDKLTKMLALGIISRILGSVFGVFKIIVLFAFLLFFLTEYKVIPKKTEKESRLVKPIQEISAFIMPKIDQHKKTVLKKIEEETEKAKEKINKKVNQK